MHPAALGREAAMVTESYLGRTRRPQSLVLYGVFSAPSLALCILLQLKHFRPRCCFVVAIGFGLGVKR